MGLGPWWYDPNVQWVMAGSALLGISSGVLGTFALLRKRSLMGDVLSHAALPGICLAFLLFQSKAIGILLLGAAITGAAAALAVSAITRFSRIKPDTALGLVLTVFFGFGVLLLTKIAHSGLAAQAGLDRFLFGQAASLVASDVKVMAGVSAVLVLVTFIFYHEFKLVCFDMDFGKGIGRPVEWIDLLLMFLIVGAVVIGLQAVGVVLMAAMLITPAIAARYWTERLSTMIVLAAAFGGLSGVAGTMVSTLGFRLSTGPLIVLAATAVFGISVLVAPGRGLAARALRYFRLRRRVDREHILRVLFELEEVALRQQGGAVEAAVALSESPRTPSPPRPSGATISEIAAQRDDFGRRLPRALRSLEREGLVERIPVPAPHGDRGDESPPEFRYRLTEKGMRAAYRIVRSHRLWEMFLMHEAELGVEHVDRDADVLEHELPEAVVTQLEELLRRHGREPVLPPSVHPLDPA